MSVVAKIRNPSAANALRTHSPDRLADQIREVVKAFAATLNPIAKEGSGPLGDRFVARVPAGQDARENELARRLSELEGIEAYSKPRTGAA